MAPLFKGNKTPLSERFKALPEFIGQLFNPPPKENLLPMEGHVFIPGTGGIQTERGSELAPKPDRRKTLGMITPTPIPTAEPTKQLTPTPTEKMQLPQKGGFRINVPSAEDEEKKTDVPENISQMLGEELDKYGLATESAQVLHHPYAKQVKGFGKGENVGFRTGPPPEGQEWWDYNYNEDGSFKYITNPVTNEQEISEDRGLFRINNQTFYTLIRSPKYRKEMKKAGIIDFTDYKELTTEKARKAYEKMYDPLYNVKMAKLIFNEYGWRAWFAAPEEFAERKHDIL